jgi:basic amino acid/polyamine antiporter, APA family
MVVAIDAGAVRAAGSAWAGVMHVLRLFVVLGTLAGLSSVMLVMMLAQPRIFYAMANDGLLPEWARAIHPRFRTPHVTTIVTGIAVSLAAGFTGIGTLGSLVSIGTLMAFVIVSIAIVFLRRTRPDLERPFSVPFVPALPIGSAVVSLVLMASLPWPTWERLIIWMAIGMAMYFVYGVRHSRLRQANAPL